MPFSFVVMPTVSAVCDATSCWAALARALVCVLAGQAAHRGGGGMAHEGMYMSLGGRAAVVICRENPVVLTACTCCCARRVGAGDWEFSTRLWLDGWQVRAARQWHAAVADRAGPCGMCKIAGIKTGNDSRQLPGGNVIAASPTGPEPGLSVSIDGRQVVVCVCHMCGDACVCWCGNAGVPGLSWPCLSRMQVGYTQLEGQEDDERPGGTHSPTAAEKCWGRQQGIASNIYWRRCVRGPAGGVALGRGRIRPGLTWVRMAWQACRGQGKGTVQSRPHLHGGWLLQGCWAGLWGTYVFAVPANPHPASYQGGRADHWRDALLHRDVHTTSTLPRRLCMLPPLDTPPHVTSMTHHTPVYGHRRPCRRFAGRVQCELCQTARQLNVELLQQLDPNRCPYAELEPDYGPKGCNLTADPLPGPSRSLCVD